MVLNMSKPHPTIPIISILLILTMSLGGCGKTPSEVEADDSVINIQDFWVYSGDKVVAKIDGDFGTFRFEEEQNPEDTPLGFPSTYGYKLEEVNTYRGAKIGDNVEELSEKYKGLTFGIICTPDATDDKFNDIELADYLSMDTEKSDFWLYLYLFRIGDEYYQPTAPEIESFYDNASKAKAEREMVRYDRYTVFYIITDGKIERMDIYRDSFNSLASRDY